MRTCSDGAELKNKINIDDVVLKSVRLDHELILLFNIELD